MDEEGTAKWYWHSHTDQNYSWINVGNFWNYANTNTGYGLVAKTNGNYYDGQVGDILIVGHSGKSHTTVISEVITSGGATVDYLICSNTANYRNFPVSAYYFTQHWLVRILGWNDVEPEDPEKLAEAIRTLRADPEKQKIMRQTCREIYLKNYTTEICTNKYVTLFRGLL